MRRYRVVTVAERRRQLGWLVVLAALAQTVGQVAVSMLHHEWNDAAVWAVLGVIVAILAARIEKIKERRER